jgi:hypothetical protein
MLCVFKSLQALEAQVKSHQQSDLKVKSTYIGDCMFKNRRFECVLIACDSQNDFEYMSPKLVAYQKCPVVTIVGNGLSLPAEFKHA